MRSTRFDALAETVDWLIAHRPERGGEDERQIGDPFDYEAEDRLIASWRRALAGVSGGRELGHPGHPYRHPKKPGEVWNSPKARPS